MELFSVFAYLTKCCNWLHSLQELADFQANPLPSRKSMHARPGFCYVRLYIIKNAETFGYHSHFCEIFATSTQSASSLGDQCIGLSSWAPGESWKDHCTLLHSHRVAGQGIRPLCPPPLPSCMLRRTPSLIYLSLRTEQFWGKNLKDLYGHVFKMQSLTIVLNRFREQNYVWKLKYET